MDISDPFAAILPGSESAVLMVLAGTKEYRSGSEIARLADRTHPTAIKSLKRLRDQGVVKTIPSGRATLYTLNRDHLAADPIIQLATLRQNLIESMRNAINEWSTVPVSATMFGSAARGDGGTGSDIDLLIVRPDHIHSDDSKWQEDVDSLVRLTFRWSGNHLAVIEVGENEVAELIRKKSSFYYNVKREGLHIAGQKFTRLTSH